MERARRLPYCSPRQDNFSRPKGLLICDPIDRKELYLRRQGIDTESLDAEIKNIIYKKSLTEIVANTNFARKRGLILRGKSGKERLAAMLAGQNVIEGLLKWNSQNNINAPAVKGLTAKPQNSTVEKS